MPAARPTFNLITWAQFEALVDDSTAYDETEIDGHTVAYVRDMGTRPTAQGPMPIRKVRAVYYTAMGVGSECPNFRNDDPVVFVEADPHWPYGN